jgi:hypothetical protein
MTSFANLSLQWNEVAGGDFGCHMGYDKISEDSRRRTVKSGGEKVQNPERGALAIPGEPDYGLTSNTVPAP